MVEKYILDRVAEMEHMEVFDLLDEKESNDICENDLGLDEFVLDYEGKSSHGLP